MGKLLNISLYSRRLFYENLDDERLTDLILEMVPLYKEIRECRQIELFMDMLLFTTLCLYGDRRKRKYGYSRLKSLLDYNLPQFSPCQLLDIRLVLMELQRRDPKTFQDEFGAPDVRLLNGNMVSSGAGIFEWLSSSSLSGYGDYSSFGLKY
ncbi:hypothetical protein GNQ08_20820 [Paenibacillus macerans]|uniref:Uncharacterized protein n=1 Tax=Paenibacillus macerans TaxID=44252 RepID=A0A6N8EYS1_PAEMA|nr:hypothetical protein [Paenibacillus macerans]MUG24814.1 hypothetical protein [Paenibacillus macerans]UMV49310.1 hypothetical protein LMZ02_08165 [Paenibacillus macerans]